MTQGREKEPFSSLATLGDIRDGLQGLDRWLAARFKRDPCPLLPLIRISLARVLLIKLDRGLELDETGKYDATLASTTGISIQYRKVCLRTVTAMGLSRILISISEA